MLAVFWLALAGGRAEEAVDPATLQRHRFSAPHLGTAVHLVFYAPGEREEAAKLARAAFAKVKELDAVFSDYREDSEVRKFERKALNTPHPVSRDLFVVMACAQKIAARTDGAFDPTLGKDTKRWRAKRDRSAETAREIPKSSGNYRHLKLDHNKQTVLFEKPLQLDLGGIAKGYIADELMALMTKNGIERAAIVIGGETVLSGPPPGKKGWRIGLENPEQIRIGTIELENIALSTSGDSYQFIETEGKREAHLIDPATRKGKSNRLNVVTLAPTAMQADAWATALRILPTDRALKLANRERDLEALFIPLGKEPIRTEHFPESQ